MKCFLLTSVNVVQPIIGSDHGNLTLSKMERPKRGQYRTYVVLGAGEPSHMAISGTCGGAGGQGGKGGALRREGKLPEFFSKGCDAPENG